MNWSDATPWLSLALSLGTIAFFAGAFYERSKATDARVKELREDMDKRFALLAAEHIRSAADQGTRLGELKDEVGTLKDFKARVEGAEQRDRDRDMSGVVRR